MAVTTATAERKARAKAMAMGYAEAKTKVVTIAEALAKAGAMANAMAMAMAFAMAQVKYPLATPSASPKPYLLSWWRRRLPMSNKRHHRLTHNTPHHFGNILGTPAVHRSIRNAFGARACVCLFI